MLIIALLAAAAIGLQGSGSLDAPDGHIVYMSVRN